MEHNFLNLNEGSFPVKIKKRLKSLNNLDQLGEIKEDIKVNPLILSFIDKINFWHLFK